MYDYDCESLAQYVATIQLRLENGFALMVMSELNLMSSVSFEEAMLLLRSSCFDKGGVAVGEIRPLSETWAKVFRITQGWRFHTR